MTLFTIAQNYKMYKHSKELFYKDIKLSLVALIMSLLVDVAAILALLDKYR